MLGYPVDYYYLNISPTEAVDQEGLCSHLKHLTLQSDQGIGVECQVFNAKTGSIIRGITPSVTRDITPFPRLQEFSSEAVPRGFEIRLAITADTSCYLYIINIGTSGVTKLVFPNEYESDNYLAAGHTHYLPGEHYGFRVEGKPGKERLQILAFSRQLRELDRYRSTTVDSDITRKHLLRDITVIKRPKSIGLQWGSAHIEFTVE